MANARYLCNKLWVSLSKCMFFFLKNCTKGKMLSKRTQTSIWHITRIETWKETENPAPSFSKRSSLWLKEKCLAQDGRVKEESCRNEFGSPGPFPKSSGNDGLWVLNLYPCGTWHSEKWQKMRKWSSVKHRAKDAAGTYKYPQNKYVKKPVALGQKNSYLTVTAKK